MERMILARINWYAQPVHQNSLGFKRFWDNGCGSNALTKSHPNQDTQAWLQK